MPGPVVSSIRTTADLVLFVLASLLPWFSIEWDGDVRARETACRVHYNLHGCEGERASVYEQNRREMGVIDRLRQNCATLPLEREARIKRRRDGMGWDGMASLVRRVYKNPRPNPYLCWW